MKIDPAAATPEQTPHASLKGAQRVRPFSFLGLQLVNLADFHMALVVVPRSNDRLELPRDAATTLSVLSAKINFTAH
jgi:hypothetical protein